jgi:hypothetical protein
MDVYFSPSLLFELGELGLELGRATEFAHVLRNLRKYKVRRELPSGADLRIRGTDCQPGCRKLSLMGISDLICNHGYPIVDTWHRKA